MRLISVLVGFVLVGAACTPTKVGLAGTSSPAPRPGATTPAASETSGGATPGTRPAPHGGSQNATTAPAPRVTPGPAQNNNMRLHVTLNRTCAEHGDEMVASAVTEAGAQIVFAAGYTSNNDLPPDFKYVPKEANPTGSHTWRWVIRPDIRPGDANLSVVASKKGKGASYNIPFRVATSC